MLVTFGGRLLRPSFTFGLRGYTRRNINSHHVHTGRGWAMMEKHDEGAKEEKSNTVTEKDLEPAKKDVDASDAAKNAPADHEATVAKTSTTSNTTASSGSHGDSSRHKKNSSSPTDVSDRDGGGWLPPLKKFFTVDNWMWKKAAEPLDYGSMSLEEKRKHYKCGRDYLTLRGIPTWSNSHKTIPYPEGTNESQYSVDPDLNKKVSLWRGDITWLEIDAIVNAANSSLLGGGGVDGAIHHAASNALRMECEDLGGCRIGGAKISGGHRLPAKYVIHTVGPIDGRRPKLQSCYHRCLELVLQHDIKSVAFSCIATGVYGYPHDAAAKVALEITREWLEEHHNKVDRIIFCVFQKVDYNCYRKLLHYYYPVPVKERTVKPPESNVKKGSARPKENSKKPALRSSLSAPTPTKGAKKPKEDPGVVPPSLSGGGGGDSVGTSASAGTPEPDRMETDPETETGDSVSKTLAAEIKVSPSLAAAPAVGEKADDGVAGGDGGVADREGETRGDDGKMDTADSLNTTEGEKESR